MMVRANCLSSGYAARCAERLRLSGIPFDSMNEAMPRSLRGAASPLILQSVVSVRQSLTAHRAAQPQKEHYDQFGIQKHD